MAASTVGQRVRQLRRRRGWTQRDLAITAELTERTVGRVETDAHYPMPNTLAQLARALEVTEAVLVGKEAMPAPRGDLAVG